MFTTYDKLHMFDVDLPNGESWRESKIYKPGDAARLVRVDEAMVGLSVCYDLRFPELYKAQAQAGAQIFDHTGRLYPPDRGSPLACAFASAGNREWRVCYCCCAGR